MLFPTITFATFFCGVYIAHLLTRRRPSLWKATMLVASYVFYGWWDWRFCGLIAGSTIINWILAYAVQGARGSNRRLLVGITVILNIGLLGVFKYYGFFVEALSSSLGSVGTLPGIEVALPIGISFYTFQALSYVVDVHRDKLECRPLLDFAVYLAFFPQLVAGPIVRASDFLPQLDRLSATSGANQRGAFGAVDANRAVWLVCRGLFKKVVIASYLAETLVDQAFAAPTTASRAELVLAFYGYALQIYADFSGYTDIAIGIALLLGFEFPDNFDNPYRSTSMQDFWRRWHITLSTWLRDYLYIPLGGNKISTLATYRNLMATMILGGLWHGAAWTFVVWGAIHGGALTVERIVSERRAERQRTAWPVGLRWLLTFHVVALAWIPFRAETFTHARDFAWGLLSAPLSGPVNSWAGVVIAVGLGAQLLPTGFGRSLYRRFAEFDPAIQSAFVGAWLFLVASLGPEGVAPFIYFQF